LPGLLSLRESGRGRRTDRSACACRTCGKRLDTRRDWTARSDQAATEAEASGGACGPTAYPETRARSYACACPKARAAGPASVYRVRCNDRSEICVLLEVRQRDGKRTSFVDLQRPQAADDTLIAGDGSRRRGYRANRVAADELDDVFLDQRTSA